MTEKPEEEKEEEQRQLQSVMHFTQTQPVSLIIRRAVFRTLLNI